jgi:hypothetical protein
MGTCRCQECWCWLGGVPAKSKKLLQTWSALCRLWLFGLGRDAVGWSTTFVVGSRVSRTPSAGVTNEIDGLYIRSTVPYAGRPHRCRTRKIGSSRRNLFVFLWWVRREPFSRPVVGLLPHSTGKPLRKGWGRQRRDGGGLSRRLVWWSTDKKSLVEEVGAVLALIVRLEGRGFGH